ncbi:MAG TPA: PstS family phosphate ABC transporter substrate-binding protein [Saprospiraceae bacterium]|nr:PstS family phosphate ABC transporter substrate-binding protein [Saprospiraceae bacterium]HMQ81771.1 PstS family phosphate ABC transporter substrate-binding protein [Saprospiraceae bacterium]
MKIYACIAVMIALLGSCQHLPEDYESITLKGSDTEVNVALALAEYYMADETTVSIAVTGGGSGAGIAALINGKTDIANSSRPIKKEELDLASARSIAPVPFIFAVDALAFIVHQDMEVDSLTLDQIAQLFSGKIANWRELGGPDNAVSLYGRQSNSGTFVYLRDSILKTEYAAHHKQMNGNAQIVEALKSDRAGIGYVGVGYILKEGGGVIAGIKTIKVKSDPASTAVSPVEQSAIANGAYPVVRPLFQYTNGMPDGKLLEFIEFGLSPKGQQIITENGYYPIFQAHKQHNEQLLNQYYEAQESH